MKNNQTPSNLMMASELVNYLTRIIQKYGDKPILTSIRRQNNEVVISNIKEIALSIIKDDKSKTNRGDQCYILKNTSAEILPEDDVVVVITSYLENEE